MKRISVQKARAFSFLKENKLRWITSQQLAKNTDISEVTARHYLLEFTKAGICERQKLSPTYLYKMNQGRIDGDLIEGLEKVVSVLNL